MDVQATLTSLKRKLHPGRYKNMSSKMAAIIGCILDEEYATPAIVELFLTADHFVLARHAGDCGANGFIGSWRDLCSNWNRLLEVAGLEKDENILAQKLFRIKLGKGC